jgi:hypothetical protein
MKKTSILALGLAALLWAGCGDDGAQTGVECARSDLIAQCPPGSNPMLDAASTSQCAAAGAADLISQEGKVVGSCEGEGSCQVLCQFAVPCDCGVREISDEGVFCESCSDGAACGNDTCEATETPESCPTDCGAVCTAGQERCNGDNREVCSQVGRWDSLSCPQGETCRPQDDETTACAP